MKDFKNIQSGLGEISSESDLEINSNTISLMFFALMFNFFRRWLIYILAVLITENLFVAVVSVVLFVIGLYDCIFNNSLVKVRKYLKVGLYLAMIDTIFISIFVIYLFVV